MQHLLVLQWPGSTADDFDELLEMEDELENRLAEYSNVDGHDFGSGQMNIYIDTDQPMQAFAEAEEILGGRPRWVDVRAAHRQSDGETYTVLWPVGLADFTVT